ncbi:chromate transporter [Paucibacter sp. KBW04]|uniref:chromate transporter n=1 Tax=Paucibacter sp. KBW04 TaxID=2153361 RepID=UPI0018CC6239|nr:chromate transporter [Paucibacter sp. KBW04]
MSAQFLHQLLYELPPELLPLFLHFLTLSLLSIGGAISTAPEMHRFLVGDQHWLSDTQFTNSIALAQAAPGPNILFVAVLGWNIAGLAGAFAAMAGIMLPSTTLVLAATRWAQRNKDSLGVRAFKAGMAPITLGLLIATGWVLAEPYLREPAQRWATVALMSATVALTLKTRLSLVWMVLAGGALGALGWV